MLPEYQVAVNVEEGDILFSQSHNLWHGNTGIRVYKRRETHFLCHIFEKKSCAWN